MPILPSAADKNKATARRDRSGSEEADKILRAGVYIEIEAAGAMHGSCRFFCILIIYQVSMPSKVSVRDKYWCV